MKIEIRVKDTVSVVDSVAEAMDKLREIVQAWFVQEDFEQPLTVVVKKHPSRGPPVLGIHVQDEMNIKTLLK